MTGTLKVMIITPRVHGIGGIAQHVRKLSEWLTIRGVEVKLITSPYLKISGLANLTAEVFLTSRTIIEKITKLVDSDVVNIHHVLYYPAARITGIPIVLTLHGDILSQYKLLRPGLKKPIEKIERICIEKSRIVTAISKIIAEKYMKRYNKIVEYIPNAIDPRDFPQVDIQKDENLVIFIGRLSKEKGVDKLLSAAKILLKINPKIRLLIIGDGPLRQYVETYAKRLPNVRFIGYKPRRIALYYLSKAKTLVLPSQYEGFPTVLLEAAYTKTAIIASNIPEISTIFTPKDAFLIEPSPKNIANAVNTLIEDDYLYKSRVQKAYKLVVENYTWDRIVNLYIEIYKKARNIL